MNEFLRALGDRHLRLVVTLALALVYAAAHLSERSPAAVTLGMLYLPFMIIGMLPALMCMDLFGSTLGADEAYVGGMTLMIWWQLYFLLGKLAEEAQRPPGDARRM